MYFTCPSFDDGPFNRPTERTTQKIANKLDESGSIGDGMRPLHHRGVRSGENIAAENECERWPRVVDSSSFTEGSPFLWLPLAHFSQGYESTSI